MTDAILFATWLPSLGEKLEALNRWFALFIQCGFGDCDIFIGNNSSPVQREATQVFEKWRGKFRWMEYATTLPELEVPSDVSGYQKAMQLLYESKRYPYRFVWFIHSKGMSHDPKLALRFVEKFGRPFLSARKRVTSLLEKNSQLGTWSPWMTISPILTAPPFLDYIHDWSRWYLGFEYPILGMFHVYTFVVMKWEPLQTFLDRANPSLFQECWSQQFPGKKRLRHFCEWFLGEIAFRQGWLPSWDQLMEIPSKNSPSPCPVTTEQVSMLIAAHMDKIHPRTLFQSNRKAIQYPAPP